MLNRNWILFSEHLCLLKNFSLPCDRSSKNINKYETVQQMGMDLFKNTIISNPFIKGCLIFEIMYIIEIKNRSEKINKNVLKSLLFMLKALHVYDEIFYEHFLKVS